jgi:hypothetical protein
MKDWPAAAAAAPTSTSVRAPGGLRRGRGFVAHHGHRPKEELAFSLGGMGSASTNYYNQAYSRQG